MIKMGKYKGNVVNDLKFSIMDKIAINNEIVFFLCETTEDAGD